MKALVIGAGVAGPLTAMALQRAGVDATVIERHDHPDPEAGSWFCISPNGLDALDAVGTLDLARDLGSPTRRNVLVGATGRELGTLPLGAPLANDTPALTMKRSRLTATLAHEAEERGIRTLWGAGLADAHREGDHVVAALTDGTTHTADVLIGADGVNSPTRRLIDPSAPEARYVGLTNFGGVTPGGAALLSGPDAEPEQWRMVFGRRAFFGHHVVPNGDVVWFVNWPRPLISPGERAATTHEQWREQLVDLMDGDTGPAAALIEAGTLDLVADNTHDLGHVPVWHRDRMVVIGDAAHAPAPSSGQGASMAAEDAVVLAQCLRDLPSIDEALAAYEPRRRARVERIVKAGARSSSTKSPGPLQQQLLRAVFRFAVTEKNTAWMYDHRITWEDRVSVR
ncbi:FAD-dependent monooxygenase [Knoellia subterranea]|uniref:FAD-dependent pyridine nucleotide-disulfide oxidoreductase n=1 Tax=Knoellia subterranea KCTC 19937 TaxID=1385521 RepID=A0A0A0JRI4_9MICO|nr:FAD-dependent monooxygenase [Knoellia subterranea]KGN38211.1 FAD-dependent pyridine nucleotide-disulfide oxidoreductase [Knoellia subterranea KCTC 19937]